jgi:hypothetical protein
LLGRACATQNRGRCPVGTSRLALPMSHTSSRFTTGSLAATHLLHPASSRTWREISSLSADPTAPAGGALRAPVLRGREFLRDGKPSRQATLAGKGGKGQCRIHGPCARTCLADTTTCPSRSKPSRPKGRTTSASPSTGATPAAAVMFATCGIRTGFPRSGRGVDDSLRRQATRPGGPPRLVERRRDGSRPPARRPAAPRSQGRGRSAIAACRRRPEATGPTSGKEPPCGP